MVITPHAVAGAVVARPLSSAPIALAAGMATHVMLDRIPHQDYSPAALALLSADAALAATLTHRLSRANPTVMTAGAIGGVLPDVAQAIERALGLNITRAAHRANHTTVVWPRWAGVSSQLVTLAVCVGAATLSDRRARRGRGGPPAPAAGRGAGVGTRSGRPRRRHPMTWRGGPPTGVAPATTFVAGGIPSRDGRPTTQDAARGSL
jgi:hypothetical protein